MWNKDRNRDKEIGYVEYCCLYGTSQISLSNFCVYIVYFAPGPAGVGGGVYAHTHTSVLRDRAMH